MAGKLSDIDMTHSLRLGYSAVNFWDERQKKGSFRFLVSRFCFFRRTTPALAATPLPGVL